MDVEDYRGTKSSGGCVHEKWFKNTIGQYVCEKCLVKRTSIEQ